MPNTANSALMKLFANIETPRLQRILNALLNSLDSDLDRLCEISDSDVVLLDQDRYLSADLAWQSLLGRDNFDQTIFSLDDDLIIAVFIEEMISAYNEDQKNRVIALLNMGIFLDHFSDKFFADTQAIPLPLFEIIINKLIEKLGYFRLFSIDDTFSPNVVFMMLVCSEEAEKINFLLTSIIPRFNYEELSYLLQGLRLSAFNCEGENLRRNLHRICERLRPIRDQQRPEQYGEVFSRWSLFFSRPEPKELNEGETRLTLLEAHALMLDRDRCTVYLATLNRLFKAYCEENNIIITPQIDDYEFIDVNGIPYPCRKDGQKKNGQSKQSALRHFLSNFLAKHGLAGNATQCIGFVEPTFATELIKTGPFFENKFGDGLFHGKYSHMIQLAILAMALEDGTLKAGKLKLPEFLNALLSPIDNRANILDDSVETYWTAIVDAFTPRPEQCFTTPHGTTSHIMRYGEKEGMPELAEALRATFCSGLMDLYQALITSNKLYTETFDQHGMSGLLSAWGDFNLMQFGVANLLNLSHIAAERMKSKVKVFESIRTRGSHSDVSYYSVGFYRQKPESANEPAGTKPSHSA